MLEPYDTLKDDFALITNKVEAQYCLDKYGYDISNKHMPDEFRYLLIEYHQKQCELISKMFKDGSYENKIFKGLSKAIGSFKYLTLKGEDK